MAANPPISQPDLIIGKVVGVYGVQGWLKILSFTEPKENILHYQAWQLLLPSGWTAVTHELKPLHQSFIARFNQCHDRDLAKQFCGSKIGISRSQLPELALGQYYWSDLIGLTVVNTAGMELGQVDYLFATGANDVLVVQGVKTYLIPYITERFIVQVNLNQGIIQVDWDLSS